MAFFTDRSIGTKIAAGFTAILLILALSSALAYAAFGRVADAVGVFGGLVANSAIYTDIDRLTALYRGHVREFVASTDAAVATGAVKEGEALRQLIADGLTKITHPERRRLLEDAGKQADLYATAFERMRVMEAEQVKLEKDVLDVVGQQVTDGLTTVATGAAKADNVDVQRLATEARRVSLLVRLDVNKRLGRHDETAAKSADEQFAALGQLLAQLDTATKDRNSNLIRR